MYNDQITRERRMGIDKEVNFGIALLKFIAVMTVIILLIELSFLLIELSY